uniref:Uncharacterized protein n=1 Tax=Pleurozia purpurea TaxID=280637 RepID=D0R008_9MARC|nr:hypothetical protein PlpuMp08 [Pleurozia purpurea]ACR19345.1 hypothetical protein PlpuMp08 [Pleurozia purpurea]
MCGSTICYYWTNCFSGFFLLLRCNVPRECKAELFVKRYNAWADSAHFLQYICLPLLVLLMIASVPELRASTTALFVESVPSPLQRARYGFWFFFSRFNRIFGLPTAIILLAD